MWFDHFIVHSLMSWIYRQTDDCSVDFIDLTHDAFQMQKSNYS